MTEKVWTVTLDFNVERKHIVTLFTSKAEAEAVYRMVANNIGTGHAITFSESNGRQHVIRTCQLLCASMHENDK